MLIPYARRAAFPRCAAFATLLLIATTMVAPSQEAAPPASTRSLADERGDEVPDWIPLGSVSPQVVRRAVEAHVRLSTRSPYVQRNALRSIRRDIETHGRSAMRIAATPLVVDLLGLEYHVLETPTDYRVDSVTRVEALELLTALGGTPARRQLRASVLRDEDPSVRSAAAELMASTVGDDPDADYRAVGDALARAVALVGSDDEVYRLIGAAAQLSHDVWRTDYPPLLQALVDIADGGYSSSTRRRAMSLLEELADR